MYSPTQQFLIYSGLFFAALVFSLLINSVFMRFARTLGMRDEQQTLIRWSSTAKPSLGGICFYILFLACFSLYGVLFPGQSAEAFRPEKNCAAKSLLTFPRALIGRSRMEPRIL